MFTIIIPYYQGTVSDKQLKDCLNSIRLQRLRDVEILLYHDGPLLRSIGPAPNGLNVDVVVTKKRYNDWGHSLRDLGIKRAKGDYIVHLNSDNILYPKSLKKLEKLIKETGEKEIYILPIVMAGVITRRVKDHIEMARTHNLEDKVILAGDPSPGTIDCMQFVMRTDIWKKHGGWKDKRIDSDARQIVKLAKKYKPVRAQILMGEHR